MPPPTEVLRPSAAEALAEWGRRVRANREQVDRFREVEERADHYAPIAANFRAEPRREDDPALDLLSKFARPEDTWLDIGSGGGRYALPLALLVREVIALDPSDGMLTVLREGMAEHGVANVRPVRARWPTANRLSADVALIAHVGYDIEMIGPFLDAMEAAAGRLCVAVLFQRRPTWAADALWPAVHGVARATLPALPEFLALQLARGRMFDVRMVDQRPPSYDSLDQVLTFARMQTWVQPGGIKDRHLRSLVEERVVEREGRFAFTWDPLPLGIVTWRPDQQASGS